MESREEEVGKTCEFCRQDGLKGARGQGGRQGVWSGMSTSRGCAFLTDESGKE